MKKLIITLGCVALAPLAFAQVSSTTTTETTKTDGVNASTETTTTTTRSSGTVSTFVPGKTIVVKTSATDPISYVLGKTVTYVTRAGKTIEASMIKPGANVEVMYDKNGDEMVVSRVIVDQD